MARVLVTGSTTGLGLAAAEAMVAGGHAVVLHARSAARAAGIGPPAGRAAGVVLGDLSIDAETRDLADQVNRLGPFDAVIHNAGVYREPEPHRTPEGHPRILAVNVVAPYLLTALVERPSRLVYLSSGMHASGRPSLDDLGWTRRRWDGTQAYCDSKLLVAALAAAVARRWPGVRSNAVDPGWVPTRMGGPSATDDLELGHRTQVWLATSEDPAAEVTGRYWYHGRARAPATAVDDPAFQDDLLDELARITGVPLPDP